MYYTPGSVQDAENVVEKREVRRSMHEFIFQQITLNTVKVSRQNLLKFQLLNIFKGLSKDLILRLKYLLLYLKKAHGNK